MYPTRLLEEAFVYASIVHGGHRRKGTPIPYISHLMVVSALVMEHGGDEEQAAAALLHDAVEDGGGAPRREDIRARFGERVARIVDECSDTDVTPKPPWRARKEAYLRHLEAASADAVLVSMADKLHNTRAILMDYRVLGSRLWERFNAPGGRADVEWYHEELARSFRRLQPGPLADEITRVTEELKALP